MKQDDIDFINKLANSNDREYSILKCIEELNELSTALAQSLTKQTHTSKVEHFTSVKEEFVDVLIQLTSIREVFKFTPEVLDIQMNIKLDKLRKYKDTIPEFGKIS